MSGDPVVAKIVAKMYGDPAAHFKLAASTVTVLAPTTMTDATCERLLVDIEDILERWLSGACEEINNLEPDLRAVVEA
jgi:hypothetical protein